MHRAFHETDVARVLGAVLSTAFFDLCAHVVEVLVPKRLLIDEINRG